MWWLLLFFSGLNSLIEWVKVEKHECDSCIINPGYSWCTDLEFSRDRCVLQSDDECKNKISFKTIEKIILNSLRTKKTVIHPQKIQIDNLKPGAPITIKSSISAPKSLPLDIYILIDSSQSMSSVRDNIVDDISNATNNLKNSGASQTRIGIGMIYDKSYYPTKSSSKYEFENYISLTDNRVYLQQKLNKLKDGNKTIGNYDIPESVYTSVLQAATCKDQIGWLPHRESIKIIFAATDQFPKTAGDGRTMGILRKYINKCQLDENGGYQQFRDYPDDNILMEELSKNDIMLLFLVKNYTILSYYEQISRDLVEIKSKARYLQNSSVVVQEIVKASQEALSQVNILPPYKDQLTDIGLWSNCSGLSVTSAGALECENKGTFSLDITITALKCYPDNAKLNYNISLVGFGNIELILSTGCVCDCSSATHPSYEFQSESCGSNGDLICGECSCYEAYSGSTCKCHESTSECLEPNDQPGLLCSGVGECECNKCVCGDDDFTIHSGKYCECDNTNCQSGVDEFCSGESQGKCNCGECVCQPQYKGNVCEQRNCEHELWNTTCFRDNDEYACRGRGTCECGQCICDFGYSGQFCETEMEGETCNKYEKCVICKLYNEKNVKGTPCEICDEVGTFKIDPSQKPSDNYNCVVTHKKCAIYFSISTTEGETKEEDQRTILIKSLDKKNDCKSPISPLILILIVVGGIILASLVLLFIAWFIKYQYDKAQYNKFSKSTRDPHFQEEVNPLYNE